MKSILAFIMFAAASLCLAGGCAAVNCQTDPPGAKVYVNGIYRGTTPFVSTFWAFETPESTAEIVLPGHDRSECPNLQRTFPSNATFFTSAPPGAEIIIDGNRAGVTPEFTILNFPYSITLSWAQTAAAIGPIATSPLGDPSLTAPVQVEGQPERDANLKAAAAGDSAAMYKLGRMYAEGTGVEKKDYAQARSWFVKAAEAGNGAAMNSLGAMYQNGLGVEKSPLQAAAWYEKGAQAGDAAAMGSLGFLYAQGLGVPQDNAKALEWTRKAAEAGSPAAMYNLGYMYAEGRGVAKDPAEARKWMLKASATFPAAKKWLADQGAPPASAAPKPAPTSPTDLGTPPAP